MMDITAFSNALDAAGDRYGAAIQAAFDAYCAELTALKAQSEDIPENLLVALMSAHTNRVSAKLDGIQ